MHSCLFNNSVYKHFVNFFLHLTNHNDIHSLVSMLFIAGKSQKRTFYFSESDILDQGSGGVFVLWLLLSGLSDDPLPCMVVHPGDLVQAVG